MGFLQNIAAKLAGKKIANELKLQEGPMEDGKKWYKSKTVWAGVAAFLLNGYEIAAQTVAPSFGVVLPPIPPFVLTLLNTILGPIVIHGRVTADSKLAA
jgi:hypothetical protein